MNYLFVGISILIVVMILAHIYHKKNNDTESFQPSACQTGNDICMNFKQCCLEGKNNECRNQNLVGCQKFKIKCQNTCTNKKINNNGDKETDINKCMESCNEVENNCCDRLYNKNTQN